MEMTVIEMMNVIGRKVKALEAATAGEARDIALADAEAVAKTSKQFFNGADLVVRAEQMKARNKTLDSSKLDMIIGGVNGEEN